MARTSYSSPRHSLVPEQLEKRLLAVRIASAIVAGLFGQEAATGIAENAGLTGDFASVHCISRCAKNI